MQPVVLFDTYSLFFRAYHALPAMNTTRGEPVSGIYGLASLLLKILRERTPQSLAFALDAPQKTFRHEQFAAYKGTRDALPSDLIQQFGRLHELLACLQIPLHIMPGFEADDVLATLAENARQQSLPAIVVSGDRDLLQLAHGGVLVLFTGARGKEASLYDEKAVEERFEVPVRQLPFRTALLGDPSDNLPNVAGIGAKTAAALVRQFGSAAQLFERLAEVQSPKVRATLSAHQAQILLTEDLARLRSDLQLERTPAFAKLSVAALQQLKALFVELEFRSLIGRVEALEASLAALPS